MLLFLCLRMLNIAFVSAFSLSTSSVPTSHRPHVSLILNTDHQIRSLWPSRRLYWIPLHLRI